MTATGTLTDSSIYGGRIPRLMFDAALADNTLHLKANGELRGFDPAAVSDKPALKGEVGGTVDVDATLRDIASGVTPDSIQAAGRIDLQPSTVGGLAIDSAVIDGDYRDAIGVIRMLEVKGRDVNLTATGTVALNETGQSNLMVRADGTNLDEIGRLIDKPLHGTRHLDGTVTGNKRELQASGHLMANDVAYGGTSALTVSTDFSAKVPDLAFERASVNADTAATFVTIGGQNINQLDAKTLGRQTTDVRRHGQTTPALARRGRIADAASGSPGSPLAAAESSGAEPELAAHVRREPTIQYADNAIAVQNLKLASGDQQIAADGTFGHPGDALSVTLSNVDLAGVDALLLRPPQFTGRLNGSSTITGTTDAPHVKADFQINQGGFRQFRYDMLSGTVDYAGKGITVDTRMQQNPTTWATAKGYVPTALFTGGAAAVHQASADP